MGDLEQPPGQEIQPGPAPPAPMLGRTRPQWQGDGGGIISAGRYHSVVVRQDAKSATFGRGGYGALGTGKTIQESRPVEARTLSDASVVCVSAGTTATAVVTENGQLLACGLFPDHDFRRPAAVIPKFQTIQGIPAGEVIGAACGYDVIITVLRDGRVFGYGRHRVFQLGDAVPYLPAARQIISLSNHSVVAVAAGVSHCLFLLADGRVATLGSNFFGELGTHRMSQIVPNLYNVVQVSAGGWSSAVVTADGRVATWGRTAN
jgi:alpha-tubulin suppressor-like RCC1 family protein